MKKSILNSIKIIALGILLSAGITYAVNPATSNPGVPFPGGNPDVPINVGPSIQTKTGALGLGLPIVVSGPAAFTGDINIFGTYVPPPEQGATLCNNGIDDDNNGYIDGADPGCGGGPIQSGFNYKNFNKKYLSSILNIFSTKKALAGHVTYGIPTNFTATINQQTQSVQLNWTDNTTNESSYEIERDYMGSGSFSPLATISANETSYIDDLASSGSGYGPYTYRVAANGGHPPSPLKWSSSKTVTQLDPSTLCQDIYATNYGGALPCAYPPSSDLYVSGKLGIGVPSISATESLEVGGGIRILYLQFTPGAVCANISGKLVPC